MGKKQKQERVFDQEEKGAPILITGGTYKGKNGYRWINGKEEPECFTYVIVQVALDKPGKPGTIGTRVLKKHVQEVDEDDDTSPPKNRVEAVIRMFPEVKYKLQEIAMIFVTCRVEEDDDDLFDLVIQAVAAAREKQEALGRQARYFDVGPYGDNVNMGGN